jgi:hypothetical protein
MTRAKRGDDAMISRVVWGLPPVLLAWLFWFGLVLWALW